MAAKHFRGESPLLSPSPPQKPWEGGALLALKGRGCNTCFAPPRPLAPEESPSWVAGPPPSLPCVTLVALLFVFVAVAFDFDKYLCPKQLDLLPGPGYLLLPAMKHPREGCDPHHFPSLTSGLG